VLSTRIPGFFFFIFKNYKGLILLLVTPFLALLPDFTFKFLLKVYYLQPADIVKRIESKKVETIEMTNNCEGNETENF